MNPILQYYSETLGVAGAAVCGIVVGLWVSRQNIYRRIMGYMVPFACLIMIGSARWVPCLEFAVPFRWIMADRTEYIVGAVIASVMLASTVPRLRHLRERRLSWIFLVLFVIFCLLPFAGPIFNFSYLKALKPNVDSNGNCYQSTNYTCGPAAVVSALNRFGIAAEEGELAILAHTTLFSGTPVDTLMRVLNGKYGVRGLRFEYRVFKSVDEMAGLEPVIAVIKYSFLVDHYVTVLRITSNRIIVADPLEGECYLLPGEFEGKWRKCGIVISRTAVK